MGDPRSKLSFVEFINVVQIEFNQFLLIVLNMKRWLNFWVMPLDGLLKGTLQAEDTILDAFDDLLSVDVKR